MARVVLQETSFAAPVVRRLLADWSAEAGANPRGGATVEVEDFAAPAGVFLVARVDTSAAGCGGLRPLQPGVGEVKRLFVRRAVRARGVGRALLAGLEQRARVRGLHALRLDTDGGEAAALALFTGVGYVPIADYNGNPLASYWFEKRLDAA